MAADRPDDQEPARALGRALRDLQRRSGRTLRDLETSVRISDSSLSRYFLGITVPPWGTVRDVCEALDGDPSEYRHLWEAADRSQRKPVRRQQVQGGEPVQGDGKPVPDDPPPSEPPQGELVQGDPVQDTGPEAASAPEESGGAAAAALPGPVRRRLSVRNGPTVWALAGAVIGLVIGAVCTALVQPRSPASGVDTPTAPHSTHGAQGASAARPDDPRIFVSRATGACLDDSLDRGTRSFACNGMSYQRWTVRTTQDGGTQLRNHATGECLDHLPGGLSTTPCGPSASQRWTVGAGDDAAVEIRSTTARRCLADSAGGLRMSPCDGTARQKWA
ncbi:helix-turn-helix domain-containing protein [Streptomyces sp. NBC_01255]|uniref:helix-turn-helix domain-containing protein n=1 Tax=Streptomyces sp. NBC_01255 TaxID=2903798 RepID=UPI002E2F304A|nr:helix-turn-helix domain-containing protein [Streptomyces sp. NBC_01255]